MKQKTQVFFIHGGMTFKSKGDYITFLKTRDISLGLIRHLCNTHYGFMSNFPQWKRMAIR